MFFLCPVSGIGTFLGAPEVQFESLKRGYIDDVEFRVQLGLVSRFAVSGKENQAESMLQLEVPEVS